MIIHGLRQTYGEFGGSAIFSYVADLLTLHLNCYGPAIEEIRLIAHLRSATRDPWIGLEGVFDDFHKNLQRLPQITFHRRRKCVDIAFLSAKFSSEDDRGWMPSVDKCATAMGEVALVLELLKRRLTKRDDFDFYSFMKDSKCILASTVATVEDWLQIKDRARAKEIARRDERSPWERLEIDWGQYHPTARTLLNDPFFWSSSDDISPHGNDTGADLLDDCRRWNAKNPGEDPMRFLEQEFVRWNVVPIDWLVADEIAVRELILENPTAVTLCNEAAIALAFAVLKLRGGCPKGIIRIALSAIQRTDYVVRQSGLPREVKAEWNVGLEKMRKVLDSANDPAATEPD